jgi:GT2 family glycosyltransferase
VSGTSAIIPTLDGLRFLRENLPTYLAQSLPFTRIIVVDNASRDGTAAAAADWTGIELLRLERNRGFAGAVNRGIERALRGRGADAIAVLNNDVALDGDWNRAAREALFTEEAYGSCATCLVSARDPRRVESAGIEWVGPGSADNALHGQCAPPLDAPLQPVFGASAGAALYRRSFLEQVGLFDEGLFAYQEDVDLAVRGASAGWKAVFAPGARGVHSGFGTNRRFPLGGTWADYYNARNRFAVLVKSLPAEEWRRSGPAIVAAEVRRLARSFGERRAAAVLAGFTRGSLRIPAYAVGRWRSAGSR